MNRGIPILSALLFFPAWTLAIAQSDDVTTRIREYGLSRGDRIVLELPTAIERLKDSSAYIIDVGTPEQFRNLPAEIPKDREILVVSHDATGATAVEAAVILRLAGFNARALIENSDRLLDALSPSSPLSGTTNQPVAQGSAPVDPVQPVERRISSAPWWLIAAAGLAVAAFAGTLLYFLVVIPKKRRRPLLDALDIIDQDAVPRFPEALVLLNTAISNGLRSEELSKAHFAKAYVLARQGEYQAAAIALRELLKAQAVAIEARYLDLWLQVRLKNYESAVERYDSSMSSYLDARQIAGERAGAFGVCARLEFSLSTFPRILTINKSCSESRR
jgi:tetratricopeptide (TPR) repeat protein